MLTVRQALALTTGRQQPPWHVKEWRSIFKMKQPNPLSVREVVLGVEQQKFIIFLEIRSLSVLKMAGNFEQFRSIWHSAPGPSKIELEALAGELSAHSVSIKFLSADRRVIGLSGVIGLADGVQSVQVLSATLDGIRDILTGGGGATGIVVAFASVTGPFSAALVTGGVLGFLISGLLVALGIYEIAEGDPEQAPAAPPSKEDIGSQASGDDMTMPELICYGMVPPGVDPDNIFDSDTVDIGDFPDDTDVPDDSNANA